MPGKEVETGQKQFREEREKGIKLEREWVEKFVPSRECAPAEPEMKHSIPLCLTITNGIAKIFYAYLVMIIHTGLQLIINCSLTQAAEIWAVHLKHCD